MKLYFYYVHNAGDMFYMEMKKKCLMFDGTECKIKSIMSQVPKTK